MKTPTGEFIWYELMTTDADAACRFYGDLLGWHAADSGMPEMDYRMLSIGNVPVGGVLQLTDEMLGGGARPGWLGYVEVADVDAAAAAIELDGGSLTLAPRDIPNVGRFAMIGDPQQIPLYIMHSTSEDSSMAFEADAVGHCAWNELATPDLAAALRFYTKHFGWTRGEKMPMGDLGDYQMFDANGRTIGGMMSAGPAGSPPMWRFYFRVAGLAEAVKKTTAAGGQVVHGPQEVPGDDEIIVGVDPQGAMFALVSRRAAA